MTLKSPVKIGVQYGPSRETYIRLPHWAEIEWKLLELPDNAHNFELKAIEHRARSAQLRICGFAFETAEAPPIASCLQLHIKLSEDTFPMTAMVRVVNVERDSGDGPYRVEGNFLASSEMEIREVAGFVRKYF